MRSNIYVNINIKLKNYLFFVDLTENFLLALSLKQFKTKKIKLNVYLASDNNSNYYRLFWGSIILKHLIFYFK
jgi:hypothetical protein